MARPEACGPPLAAKVILVATAWCVAGCSVDAAPRDKAPPARRSPRKLQADLLIGRIVATNATKLRAPQNRVKIAGWQADHAWIRLRELKEEGAKVKKGEVVAQFKLWFQRVLPYLQRRLRRAKAESSESTILLQRKIHQLLAELQESRIAAATAKLDTLKARAISRRQLSMYQIAHRQAEFRVAAVARRIAAYRKKMAADNAYHTMAVNKAKTDYKRFFKQKAKYTLKAPHDGVVRHTYNRRRRRKIKSGDGMPSGLPVVLIARDNQVRVRFFVPEHKFKEVKIGDRLEVIGPGGGKHPATVREIDLFPQELGFLREDRDLPNARDKAFAVVGDFASIPRGVPAGSEVRVRLRGEGA